MRSFSCVLAAAVLAFGVAVLLPAEQPAQPKTAAKVHRHPRSTAKRAVSRVLDTPLDQTVRLTFIVTNDDGNHEFPVLCAGGEFVIDHDIVEADGGHQMSFVGRLQPADTKDAVAATFDLLNYHRNDVEGFEASFTLKGSAVLSLGKMIEVGRLGEDKVSLKAEVVK